MKKAVLIISILFLFASGCIQNSSEVTEKLSVYTHPDTGFTMKYPQSWIVNETTGNYHVIVSSPDNQASFGVIIDQWNHPEGMEEGDYGISGDRPNSTPIENKQQIQISGTDGLGWTFLVNDGKREYINGIVMLIKRCPELPNNRILYHIDYDYPRGDVQLENTVKTMLNSIGMTCPSKK